MDSFDMSVQAEEVYTDFVDLDEVYSDFVDVDVDVDEVMEQNVPTSPQGMFVYESALNGLVDFLWESAGGFTDGSGRVVSTEEIAELYDESINEPETKIFMKMAGLIDKRDFISYVKGLAVTLFRM